MLHVTVYTGEKMNTKWIVSILIQDANQGYDSKAVCLLSP